jgi:hypothetical protein
VAVTYTVTIVGNGLGEVTITVTVSIFIDRGGTFTVSYSTGTFPQGAAALVGITELRDPDEIG